MNESYTKNAEFMAEKLHNKRRCLTRIKDTLLYGRSIKNKIDYIRSVTYNENMTKILSYYSFRLLFNAFIQARNPKYENEICYLLRCYDVSLYLLRFQNERKNETVIKILMESCPDYHNEKRVKNAIAGTESFDRVLEDLINYSRSEIECNRDYWAFRYAMEAKTPLIKKLMKILSEERPRVA